MKAPNPKYMTKTKNPGAKKELDYDRQHFSPGKNDKAFRKQWPKRKQRAIRRERRIVALNLNVTSQDLDAAEKGELRTYDVRKEKPTKWHIESLKERVQRKRERRLSSFKAKIKRQNEKT